MSRFVGAVGQQILEKANKGNARFQYLISNCYAQGIDVSEDQKAAVNWCLKAAESEHYDAQMRMGCYYKEGKVLPQNFKRAIDWFLVAAENNQTNSSRQAKAFSAAAECYLARDPGMKRNIERAIQCYKQAIALGDTEAQKKLLALQLPAASNIINAGILSSSAAPAPVTAADTQISVSKPDQQREQVYSSK